MGFVIQLDVDAAAGGRIRTLWPRLHRACGGIDLVAIGAWPHVSLAFVERLAPDDVRPMLVELAGATAAIAIDIVEAAVFHGERNVVYLALAPSSSLASMHATLHRRLAAIGIASHPHFLPEGWIPHCTVSLDLPSEAMPAALELCAAGGAFGPAALTALSLVEYPPLRELLRCPLRSSG